MGASKGSVRSMYTQQHQDMCLALGLRPARRKVLCMQLLLGIFIWISRLFAPAAS